MWTIDTLGWNGATTSQIMSSVLDGAGAGVIVLMHVGAASRDAEALPGMIDQLRARLRVRARDFIGGTIGQGQFFPETGQWVSGRFLACWRRHGGVGY